MFDIVKHEIEQQIKIKGGLFATDDVRYKENYIYACINHCNRLFWKKTVSKSKNIDTFGMRENLAVIACWAVKFLYDIMGKDESVFERIKEEIAVRNFLYEPLHHSDYIGKSTVVSMAVADMHRQIRCMNPETIQENKYLENEVISVAAVAIRFLMDLIELSENEK